MAVAGKAVGDDELALAGSSRDRGLTCVTLKGVRRHEIGDVADLTGHPGGETITETGKAQVDLAARDRRPPVIVLGKVTTRPRCPDEQLTHAPFPGPALRAEGEK